MKANINLLDNKEFLRGLLKQSDLLNTINGGVSMTSVDMKETESSYIIRVYAPSVSGDAFSVVINGNQLIIYSVIRQGHEEANVPVPMFSKTFDLPAYVDADKIEAFRKEGQVKVVLPFKDAAQSQPRIINIKPLQ